MRQAAARDDSFELATASSDGENGDRRGALSSVVEHFLHTEGVAGSKPAARTIPFGCASRRTVVTMLERRKVAAEERGDEGS